MVYIIFFSNSKIVFEFFTMHWLPIEKISKGERSSIFKLARHLHFSVESSFILQFHAGIRSPRNFLREKSIAGIADEMRTEMQSRRGRDIYLLRLNSKKSSVRRWWRLCESIPRSGRPSETGSSPCAACTGIGLWHMPAHVFPLSHPPRPPSAPPHLRVYTYRNGSLPHPFTHPPHLRRSLWRKDSGSSPTVWHYVFLFVLSPNAHRVAADETLS